MTVHPFPEDHDPVSPDEAVTGKLAMAAYAREVGIPGDMEIIPGLRWHLVTGVGLSPDVADKTVAILRYQVVASTVGGIRKQIETAIEQAER